MDDWLQSQDTYTLHKPVTKRFRRRKTIVGGINDQFQADLIDMQKYKDSNKGNSFILTVIDVFSKYAWASAIKSKQGHAVAKQLREILMQRTCLALQTDKGKEFYNQEVKNLLNQLGVTHFSTENEDIKASIVERFNKTLRNKIARWFTKTNEFEYISILPDLIYAYNNSIHRSIGMSPAKVTNENAEDVWWKMYGDLGTPIYKTKFHSGEMVRISKYRHAFSRGYDKNWSTEIFVVSEVKRTDPVTYKIRDLMDEEIIGSYYDKELQRVQKPETFMIEEILERRKVGKQNQLLVKYKGYPSKFNQWISDKQLA